MKKLLQKIFAPKAHFVMGEGKVLVQTGEFEGRPVLVLAPAENPGVPGEDASRERSSEHGDVLRKSVILSFPNEARRDAVEKALLGK
jgi:hypothetical protein